MNIQSIIMERRRRDYLMANRQVEIENQAMKNILISMRNLGGVATRKEIRYSRKFY